MLKVENLVKTFKGGKEATLKGLNFEVNDGEVIGLVGKNGAGKSTTLKCILGILPFEAGKISLDGYDIKKDEKKVKSLIGYVPDNHKIYENLTGREYLNFMADVYGVNDEKRRKNIKYYGDLFEMTDALDMQISSCSHGMHQKLCIMGALVHDPKMWVLDEPFLGLDIASINKVVDCVRKYAKTNNHIVLFSSHSLDNVFKVCDKVCVVEKGRIVGTYDLQNKKNYSVLQALLN